MHVASANTRIVIRWTVTATALVSLCVTALAQTGGRTGYCHETSLCGRVPCTILQQQPTTECNCCPRPGNIVWICCDNIPCPNCLSGGGGNQ